MLFANLLGVNSNFNFNIVIYVRCVRVIRLGWVITTSANIMYSYIGDRKDIFTGSMLKDFESSKIQTTAKC